MIGHGLLKLDHKVTPKEERKKIGFVNQSFFVLLRENSLKT